MKKYQDEIEQVMLNFPAGIPVAGLKAFEPGEPKKVQRVRGRVNGAIVTEGVTPDEFRKIARNLIKNGLATVQDGYFKMKEMI